MAADFTISQAGGAGAGTLNTELLAVWGGLVLQLDAAAAAAYSWTILDKPHGAVATIVSPTAQNATLTPDDLPGRWRIQLTTPDGSRVLVFEVTKTVAGVVYNFGLGVTPAHLERPSEAGGRGAARVFERFRASLLSLISALPGAEKLLLRDATGAAVASSFTGGSTLDTEVTADAARVVHVGRVGDARLRFGSASGLVYLDRWDAGLPGFVPSGIFGAAVDTLYMSDGAGTAEVILGPSSAAISSGGVCSLTAGTTLTLSAGSLDCAITNVSGTYQVAPAAPMRIQPAQAVSGAGRDYTFGGGPGQTPGTHAPGNSVCDLGTPVSGVVAKCSFITSAGELGAIDAGFTNFLRIQGSRNNSGLLLYATNSGSGVAIAANVAVTLQSQAATGHVTSTAASHRWQDQASTEFERWVPGSATIASATTTNVVSYTATGSKALQVICKITVSNDTDDEVACFWFRALFKRVGSTLSQVGTTQTIAADIKDTNQSGLVGALDHSGDVIRGRLTTPSGDTVNAAGKLEISERVLV